MRFSLPGTPVFPSLTDDTILKPRLEWMLATDKAGQFPAEFSYVTGGMSWEADYNIVAPEKGDLVDIVGWVTMDNQTGKTFENARIKLMAGDVNKIQPGNEWPGCDRAGGYRHRGRMVDPPVTEKAFDEYHLYTLERATTLRDRETKQVEFIHAAGVATKQLYIYDGVKIDRQPLQRLELGQHPQRSLLRHRIESQNLGDARVRQLTEKPSRHAAAQRPSPFLPPQRRRPDRIHRRKCH